jgi:hypothetical protein
MPRLQDIYLDLVQPLGQEPIDSDALIRAAAHCRCLKKLKVGSLVYTQSLDQALAQFVLTCSRRVDSLTILCGDKSEVAPMVFACPLLLEAFKKVYYIQRIRFRLGASLRTHSCSWEADTTASVSMISRLNRSRRCYMTKDSSDQPRVLKVLGAVNDDWIASTFICARILLCASTSCQPT